MIVWVASFPRSGNTFLRMLMHQMYGVRTSVVYDVDAVAQRLGPSTIGYEDRPASYDDMRASDVAYFVKTHHQRDQQIHEDDRTLYLVRDGRDALVSWARQASEVDELPHGPAELFWSRSANVTAMERLGYERDSGLFQPDSPSTMR